MFGNHSAGSDRKRRAGDPSRCAAFAKPGFWRQGGSCWLPAASGRKRYTTWGEKRVTWDRLHVASNVHRGGGCRRCCPFAVGAGGPFPHCAPYEPGDCRVRAALRRPAPGQAAARCGQRTGCFHPAKGCSNRRRPGLESVGRRKPNMHEHSIAVRRTGVARPLSADVITLAGPACQLWAQQTGLANQLSCCGSALHRRRMC